MPSLGIPLALKKTYSFKNEGKLRGTMNGARLCHQINTHGLASESFASGTQLILASAGKVYALNDALLSLSQ